MQFGVCVNMLPGHVDHPIWWAQDIARLGYDYIELPLGEVMGLSQQDFANMLATLEGLNLPCYACNNMIAKGIKLVGEQTDEQLVRDYCVRALDRAKWLGCKRVVLGSPWAKAVPEGFSKQRAWAQMVELCQFLGERAGERDIIVVLEHNNKGETNFLNQLWQVTKLARQVAHPNVGVLVDYYHLCVEDEPVQHISHCADLLFHAHFAKIEGRTYPAHLDEDNGYLPFAHALHQINYQGGLSIEAYSSEFSLEGEKTLAFFKTNFG